MCQSLLSSTGSAFSRLAANSTKASILGARWARPLVTRCTGSGGASQACSRRTSLPDGQLVGHLVGQELGHAAALARGAQAGLDVVDAQPAHQARRGAQAGEAPFPVGAHRPQDRLVMHQVARRARRAAALEIGRACHPKPPHVADQPRRQRRIGKRADAQGDVDALVYEIDVAVSSAAVRPRRRLGRRGSARRPARCGGGRTAPAR